MSHRLVGVVGRRCEGEGGREMRDEGLNSGTGQNSCEKGLKRSNKTCFTLYFKPQLYCLSGS